jgi:hypothetical protein
MDVSEVLVVFIRAKMEAATMSDRPDDEGSKDL